jgi:hypothetical protein
MAILKAKNQENTANAASVASTKNGNGNNQNYIHNSELPPFKSNITQQSQLRQQSQVDTNLPQSVNL